MKLFFCTPNLSFNRCAGSDAEALPSPPTTHDHGSNATSSRAPSNATPGFAAVDRMAETKR